MRTTSARGVALDAAKLRQMRQALAMTQSDLAVSADVSDDAISRAEQGRAITPANATAIAAFFNVELGSLLASKANAEELPSRPQPPPGTISNIPIRVPEHFLGRDEAAGADRGGAGDASGARRDHDLAWAARGGKDGAGRRLCRAAGCGISRDLVGPGRDRGDDARRSGRARGAARLGRCRRAGGSGGSGGCWRGWRRTATA